MVFNLFSKGKIQGIFCFSNCIICKIEFPFNNVSQTVSHLCPCKELENRLFFYMNFACPLIINKLLLLLLLLCVWNMLHSLFQTSFVFSCKQAFWVYIFDCWEFHKSLKMLQSMGAKICEGNSRTQWHHTHSGPQSL